MFNSEDFEETSSLEYAIKLFKIKKLFKKYNNTHFIIICSSIFDQDLSKLSYEIKIEFICSEKVYKMTQ